MYRCFVVVSGVGGGFTGFDGVVGLDVGSSVSGCGLVGCCFGVGECVWIGVTSHGSVGGVCLGYVVGLVGWGCSDLVLGVGGDWCCVCVVGGLLLG